MALFAVRFVAHYLLYAVKYDAICAVYLLLQLGAHRHLHGTMAFETLGQFGLYAFALDQYVHECTLILMIVHVVRRATVRVVIRIRGRAVVHAIAVYVRIVQIAQYKMRFADAQLFHARQRVGFLQLEIFLVHGRIKLIRFELLNYLLMIQPL